MTATARSPRPYRVVDRFQRGWVTAIDPCETYPQHHRTWTFAELEAERGPLRPVVAMPDTDRDVLASVLVGAGREAVGTVIAGLFRLSQRCYTIDNHDARLMAGEPESWQSRLLPRFAWEVGLNLSNRRVHPRALTVIERVIGAWIFTNDTYVEVAGNLATVLALVIHEMGEYELVTDQWLRHGALAEEICRWATSKV